MDFKFFKKSFPTLAFLVLFSIVVIPIFYHLLKVDSRLKIYNPADVNPRLVHESILHVQKNHTIADFKLINQNGDTITNNEYEGKI